MRGDMCFARDGPA